MPLYEITTKGVEEKRLVKAPTAAAALRYCAKDQFQARTVGSAGEAADLFSTGLKIETAE